MDGKWLAGEDVLHQQVGKRFRRLEPDLADAFAGGPNERRGQNIHAPDFLDIADWQSGAHHRRLLIKGAGKFADLLRAGDGGDHDIVAIYDDDRILKPDNGHPGTIAIDQDVVAIHHLDR